MSKNLQRGKNTPKFNNIINANYHVTEARARFSSAESKLSAPSMPICHVLVRVPPLIGSPAPELQMFPKLAQPELVTGNYIL